MRTRWMKIAALAACLTMLFAAGAQAEDTTLTVFFQGLTADGNGAWQMTPLEGSFDVTRDGKSLGQVAAGGEPLTLTPGGNVTLTPVMDTMPKGYLVDASYTATVTANNANRAPVMVYADAGLFRFSGTPGDVYTLLDARGAQVMTCPVAADGIFAPAQAVASGRYILLDPDGSAAAVFEVAPYKGAEAQITQVAPAAEDTVAVLVSADEACQVTLVRLGKADGEALVALPSGWRVADGADCLHGQERDYVLLSGSVAQLSMRCVTAAEDALYRPLDGTAGLLTPELVFPIMEDEEETLAAEVYPCQASGLSGDAGETVRGVAEPGKRLMLSNEEGVWLAIADEAGNFAFVDVTGSGRYTIEGQDGPWVEMDAASALAQTIDMRMPATTDVPTQVPPVATPEPTQAPTMVPTLAPTEVPTPTPTLAPTEAPQASDLSGTASITIDVFIDANNNGERGKYERLLAEAEIKALYRMPGGYWSEAASGVTDAQGQATLANLPAGEYVLEVTLPAGYGFTKHGKTEKATSNFMEENSERTTRSEAFTLAEGESRGIGVGVGEMASLSGVIWLDANADGIKNNEETGQAGVQIQLTSEKNGLTYETVSGEDGSYAFPQVKPGVYKLRVTAPEGTGFTRYSETGRENRSVITTEGAQVGVKQYELKSGDEKTLQHVGLIQGATIRGTCFLDANYNGFMDEGEAALAGVKLELIKQQTGKTVATVTCGDDGVFAFSGLREGSYRLRAVLPQGAAFTCMVEGGNQFKARTGRREYTVDNIAVATGETCDMVVGAILPAAISGVAYLDDDFSGVQDGKEKVVSGMVIRLWDAEGNEVATSRTNAKGVYTFENIVPGQYRLTTSAKKGYAFTKLGAGNVMINQGDGAGSSELFTVSLGVTLDGMDMGMILPGVVEGVFFADKNDNGLMDEDEGGMVGAVVRLMSEEGEHFSAEIGEDGSFRFDAVMPGKYYLRYELPVNGTVAMVAKGGNTLTGDQIGATDWFNFATGATYEAPLAGGLLLGEISGMAFEDHNGSGVQDAGEAAVAGGLTLTLTPSRKDIAEAVTTTDANGSFYFGSLRPDTYTLTVAWADGRVLSRTDGLALPLVPGLAEQSVAVDLAMGDHYMDQALGSVKPAALSGQAWLDENNDGMMDAGEARPQGIAVTVVDEATGEVFARLTTDEKGSFALDGVIPGSYTIACDLTDELVAPAAGDCTFTEAQGRLVMEHVTLEEGASLDGLRLGLVRLNRISGEVWVDAGGSYMPLAGAVVSLTDAAGAPLASVSTEEDGAYAFPGLMPGDYYVAVTLPEGYLVVEPEDERLTSGGRTSVMTQCSGRTGQSAAITVEMMETYAGLDIGSVLPGRLGDLCWLDENGNGLQDSDEMGLSGVRIELMRGDQVMAEAVSDQYGYWCMKEVYPATYTLRVTPPAEVKPTQRSTAVPAIASVLEEGEGEVCFSTLVTVVSNKSNYQADLGFVLRKSGAYPEGYGVFATQDWTKILVGE